MYAVWRGITLGLYFLWKDYQQQTNGYNRAEYKSFKHVRDVEEYLWRGPIY
jgi:viroplasmin and RNaseH domain-containing protein